MKLKTDIKLRRDGTVKASTPDGAKYEFKPDETGAVVCDVADEAGIAYLLDTGYFYPADEEDIDAGLAVVKEGEEGDDDVDGDTPPPPVETPKKRGSNAGK